MTRALVVLALAACGDGTMMAPPDAGADGSVGIAPLPVTFERIFAPATPIPSALTRGPDGELVALRGTTVVVSTDAGATFTPRASVGGSGLLATSTAVFATNGAQQLVWSVDGGASFAPPAAAGLPALPVLLAAATPTTLWVRFTGAGTDPPRFFRSTNDGASFTEVALASSFPGSWTLVTGGEHVYVYTGEGHVYRYTGPGWEDLGQFQLIRAFTVTQAGTALMLASPGLHRRALAAATWTVTAGAPYGPIAQRPNGELVRVVIGGGNGGATDTSTDDGVTWAASPVLDRFACSIGELLAFDNAVVGTCYDATGYYALRLAQDAWSVTPPDGLGQGPYTDLSFTAAGRVIVSGRTKVYTSEDAGATWRAGRYTFDSTAWIRAIAASPDGARIFVGHGTRRWSMLDGAGDSATTQLANLTLPVLPVSDELAVTQAQFQDDLHFFVATANEANTIGTLFDGYVGRTSLFFEVNPFELPQNPQARRTVGYHGLAACPYAGSYALVVGARQWISTNGYQDHIRIQYKYAQDSFQDLERAVGYGQPLSISCAPNGNVAWVYAGDRIFVGALPIPPRPVEEVTLDGAIRVAKFSPDDHLWVITEHGLWRSSAPIDRP